MKRMMVLFILTGSILLAACGIKVSVEYHRDQTHG